MNALDYLVLLGTMLGIAAYGIWRTRGRRDLKTYLKGSGSTPWFIIGISVIATQASATTFLSIPGQGFQDGLGFVQNYFGGPFAMIIIAVAFLPIYRRLNVYTAYEYLGKRFDTKTRLLGAALFLLQRGLGAGLTIYAPAIVLSTVFGWSLSLTIICSGLVATLYTVTGGSEAVTLTQKYQLGVIFAGMVAAFFILLSKLPAGLTLNDAFTLAGGFHKMKAVDFSPNVHERYTFWSGIFGGTFLMLSYFGTDQSQVQRYLSGASVRESRLGLMFHAVVKIPMQFFILLLGVMLFVFYQFEQPPVYFNEAAFKGVSAPWTFSPQADFAAAHTDETQHLKAWITARQSGDTQAQAAEFSAASVAHDRAEDVHTKVKDAISKEAGATANDADYIFITFILNYLPHGLIGLLVAVFFAAALSSKAAELNALGTTTTVDIYRHIVKRDGNDRHYVVASKCFTAFWGLVAIGFALFAHLSENLVQAANILGSVFYGAPLGMFLVAFFLRRIGGTGVFWGVVAAQLIVIALYFLRNTYDALNFSYLWYNIIGCALCMAISIALHTATGAGRSPEQPLAS